MRDRYFYEWCIEEWDEHDDIQDHDFADSLSEYESLPTEEDKEHRLCLVWHRGNDYDGETDRGYAYVKFVNGSRELPDIFTDTGEPDGVYAHDVPKKYKKLICILC